MISNKITTNIERYGFVRKRNIKKDNDMDKWLAKLMGAIVAGVVVYYLTEGIPKKTEPVVEEPKSEPIVEEPKSESVAKVPVSPPTTTLDSSPLEKFPSKLAVSSK